MSAFEIALSTQNDSAEFYRFKSITSLEIHALCRN